jgi:release factor glutamine methyltransferase
LALTGISAADGKRNHRIDPRGLSAIQDIVAGGINRLEPGGFLLIEHGFDQQNDVIALMDTAGFVLTQGIQDLSGQPRAVLGLKSPE